MFLCQASVPSTGEFVLSPFALLEQAELIMQERTESVHYGLCTDFFIEELRTFLKGEAKQQVKTRRFFKLPAKDLAEDQHLPEGAFETLVFCAVR